MKALPRTFCFHGHEMVGDNVYISSEGRVRCRACKQEYARKSWRKLYAPKVCDKYPYRTHGLSIRDRLMRHVVVNERGCWIWQLKRNQSGYGRTSVKSRGAFAHRASYEAFVGPIPEGLFIDHLCREPSCINPSHLEPVTTLENVARGKGAKKTHCKYGHPFSGENLYVYDGGKRACKACNKRNWAESKLRKKQRRDQPEPHQVRA